MAQTLKLAVVATHPIQYQVPLWRALAQDERVEFRVFYASRHGLEPSFDPQFGETFSWDIPLLEGYQSDFCMRFGPPRLSHSVQWQIPIDLLGRLRASRFDAVLTHGYASGAALATIAACSVTRTPVILRGDSHSVGRDQPFLRRTGKKLVLQRLLRRVSGVLAIGAWNYSYWKQFGVPADRIRTALYCVDNERMKNAVEAGRDQVLELRREWKVSNADVVFLFAAKMTVGKRPDRLLRAFAELKAVNARLVLVGSGSLEPELRKLAKALGIEPVWAGFVNQSKIPLYYAAADVTVLPSALENWGLTVNESMACGTPCIVSDVVAAGADLIENQDTGAIFRCDDVADLCTQMRRALKTETRALWKSRMSGVISRATPQVFANELIALCRSVTVPSGL